jgi:hypothetical protein
MSVMAKRAKLSKSAFAIPSKRLYPINTKRRAQAALAYAARPTTRGSYATVRKAVLKRYPELKQTGKRRAVGGKGSVSRSMKRGTARKTVRRG